MEAEPRPPIAVNETFAVAAAEYFKVLAIHDAVAANQFVYAMVDAAPEIAPALMSALLDSENAMHRSTAACLFADVVDIDETTGIELAKRGLRDEDAGVRLSTYDTVDLFISGQALSSQALRSLHLDRSLDRTRRWIEQHLA